MSLHDGTGEERDIRHVPPPPPKSVPKRRMAIGDPVVAISRASDLRIDGTFDGVFQVDKTDAPGEHQTMFWIKDDRGDRYRFFPGEVRTRQL